MYKVVLNKISDDLDRCPKHIQLKLQRWALLVEEFGLPKIRCIPGYHDEPLKGRRQGQRSIRLSRSYRAIYFELHEGRSIFVVLVSLNKHEY